MIIEAIYTTGANLYAIIHNPANGQYWNNNSLAFEAFNGSHWSNYAIPLTEQSNTGYYTATYPVQIVGVLTSEVAYTRSGGSPALGDAAVTIGQTLGKNVASIGGNVEAAINSGLAAGSEVQGVAEAGTLSTTQMTSDLGATLAGAYIGRFVIWTSGVLTDVAAAITGYNATGGLLTFTPVGAAPSIGDTFIIV